MILHAVTIFASAFLLFLVQPVMAKQILPWFGGSATVWTTCLVFFQSALLAGYAYADLLVRRATPRAALRIHVALLAASLALLPIVPAAHWKPAGGENPTWLILGMLVATIGLPYFLLSTTSPLVQAWFARQFPGRSPYRLFALSNLASMLALAGYPFLFEPWVATRAQAIGWSAGYAGFVLLCAFAGWVSLRATPFAAAPVSADTAAESADGAHPALARQALWIALSATGSILLLAISNHITQNVAAVPLLWIVPLSLYLLTFILCFDGTGWYRRDFFLSTAAAALGVMAWTLADTRLTHELAIQLGVFCAGLFLACMFCHGELARLKPAPRWLTRFYLTVSFGGALGAVVVGIAAPLVLPAYFELGAALVLCAGLLLWQVRRDPLVFRGLAVASLVAALGCGAWYVREFYDSTIVATRNFYGVLRVLEWGSGNDRKRTLIHGTIMHGNQFLDPLLKRQPTTYYTAGSGVARAIESMHPRLEPLKVGVIGLGTGTLAVWGAVNDVYRFYEINPAVVGIARREFSFLADSEATIEIAQGDARLVLEREPAQGFDVLAIDAFSSDAIPVHLITSEALSIYERHMKPSGIVAFHVTNRFLNLAPVVEALAHAHGLAVALVSDDGNEPGASSSVWVLLSKDPAALAKETIAGAASEIAVRRDWRLWTDDFNNLVQVLK